MKNKHILIAEELEKYKASSLILTEPEVAIQNDGRNVDEIESTENKLGEQLHKTLEHKLYPLEFIQKEKYKFEVYAGKTYSETPFLNIKWKPWYENKVLLRVSFTVIEKKDSEGCNVFLCAFYNKASHSQEMQDIMLPMEKIRFRGIGKKVLCMALQVIMKDNKHITPTSYITLEASGSLPGPKDRIKLNTEEIHRLLTTTELHKEWLRILKEENNLQVDSRNNKFYEDIYEGFTDNQELVRYYERTFAFKQIPDENMSDDENKHLMSDFYITAMGAQIKDVLLQCEEYV